MWTSKGDIEFILVHPPGVKPSPVNDPRMKQIVCALRGEIIQLGTVTGHFSYFLYEVIRDALTGELQWQLDYDQV